MNRINYAMFLLVASIQAADITIENQTDQVFADRPGIATPGYHLTFKFGGPAFADQRTGFAGQSKVQITIPDNVGYEVCLVESWVTGGTLPASNEIACKKVSKEEIKGLKAYTFKIKGKTVINAAGGALFISEIEGPILK